MRFRFFYDHPGANGKASAGIDALRARCAHDEAEVPTQLSRCSVAEGAASRPEGIGNESVSRRVTITLTCKSFAFP